MIHTAGMRVEKTGEYRDWIDGLKDAAGRTRILVHVDRLVHGNAGSHRNLTHGVSELTVDVGPGYRVYYAQRGKRLLLLLARGGTSPPRPRSRRKRYASRKLTERSSGRLPACFACPRPPLMAKVDRT
jgi:putative addiction module killer protein